MRERGFTVMHLLAIFLIIAGITMGAYLLSNSEQKTVIDNLPIPLITAATTPTPQPVQEVSPDPNSEVGTDREKINAATVFTQSSLSESDRDLVSHFSWPKLKPFKTGDKVREVYLVDCNVTNDALGVQLIGLPQEVPNVPNIAEVTLVKLMDNHYGGFPNSDEIQKYETISQRTFKNSNSGINGVILDDKGVLTINFFDSVAAYGGGSSRIACMRLSVDFTAMQFPSIKQVKMCVDKYKNCEYDFQP